MKCVFLFYNKHSTSWVWGLWERGRPSPFRQRLRGKHMSTGKLYLKQHWYIYIFFTRHILLWNVLGGFVISLLPLSSELVSDKLCTRSILFMSIKTSLVTSTHWWPWLFTIRSTSSSGLPARSSLLSGIRTRLLWKYVNCRNHLNFWNSFWLKTSSVLRRFFFTADVAAAYKN